MKFNQDDARKLFSTALLPAGPSLLLAPPPLDIPVPALDSPVGPPTTTMKKFSECLTLLRFKVPDGNICLAVLGRELGIPNIKRVWMLDGKKW